MATGAAAGGDVKQTPQPTAGLVFKFEAGQRAALSGLLLWLAPRLQNPTPKVGKPPQIFTQIGILTVLNVKTADGWTF
jgi:hypothetical protein